MSQELKQEIFLSGGMNSVSDPRLLPQGDYLPGTRNVRIGVTSNNTLGSVQSFEGNLELTEVSNFLDFDGEYKCVGQVADVKSNAMVMFIWNSLSGIFYRNLPTSVSSSSLTVITESWTVNQWQNHRVRIVSGAGVNQIRDIVSNSTSALNLAQAWDVLPDTSSQFVIERVGHQIIRYFFDSNVAERICIEPCLNFKKDIKIHSADVIDDLLYWVQDDEPQKKINMRKASIKDKYIFKLFIGPENPGIDTTYRIKINGTFDGPYPTIPLITIDYGYTVGDTLREVLVKITNDLNASTEFAGNFFTARYVNDCVEVESQFNNPISVGGNWDVVTSATYGELWWVGINFYSYINEETLDVLKWPAWQEPNIALKFDPDFIYNYLKGTRFQFAVKYLYDDGEVSKYSPFSVMALDKEIVGSDLTDTNKNYVEVDISDNGRMQAKRNILVGIEVAVRDQNNATFKKVANLSASELTGVYRFYNDSAYSAVPLADTIEGQDFIPLSSKAQDIVLNRLNYANNLEGFENTAIDVKLSTEYTQSETGPGTYNVSGTINILSYVDDSPVSIVSNKFGVFGIPQNGFTVFLAGTQYKAVTVQSGTNQNFVITGVPNGRYYLRVASHICQNGGVTWGDIYNTSNPDDLRWQNTSTFVRRLSRVIEVFVNNGNVVLGSPIIVDSLPSSSLVDVLGTPQLDHIYGYVYDGQNPYIGYPVSGSNIRNGLAMEIAAVEWKYWRINYSVVQGTVLSENSVLKTINISNAAGLNVGDVIFIKITGSIPDGISRKITNIAGAVLTLDQAVSAGYVGQNVYKAALQTLDVETDERGFFYIADSNTNPVVRWESIEATYGYAVIKDITDDYYIGNLSPETPILTTSPGFQYNVIDPFLAFNQAYNILFMPNYYNVITRDYRATIEVSVKDSKNNPLESILVSFSGCARQTITDASGVAKIIVYGFDQSPTIERIGRIILGNPSQFNIVTYVTDSHNIALGQFTFPPYNNATPFNYEFTGVEISRIFSYLKHGAKYRYGIVYYDRGNRRGFVNNSQYADVSIPFWVPNEQFRFLPLVSWEISHRPPIWATHYSWVRTRNLAYNSYLQIPIQGAEYIRNINQDGTVALTTYAAGDALYIDINIKTLDAYKNTFQKSILAYSFSEGDRIRLIKNQLDTYYNQYIDFEIVSYDTTTFKVRVKNITTAPEILMDSISGEGPTIEIYSPIKIEQESLFFEICETYEIGNPYTENRFHRGPAQDQSGDLTNAATGMFQSGDTYIIKRDFNVYTSPTTPVIQTRFFESSFLSDFITNSDDINIGRPNIVNLQAIQQWLEAGIRHSNPILINTLTNGLSTWDNESQAMLGVIYGPICRIVAVGYILKCYQSFKKTSIYIGRVFAQSADGGTGTLTTISGYYGTINPSEENYGCQHPESVVASDNKVWFFDIINGCIVRDSINGMEAISDKKMYSYVSDKSNLASLIGPKAKIYSTFDSYYDELYFSFVDESEDPNLSFNDTIIYLEKENEFKEQLDLFRINDDDSRTYPDIFGARGKILVSWLDGTMWIHNSIDGDTAPANFYGTQHKPQIKIAANLNTPEVIKVFTDITINANKVWFAPNDTDIVVPKTALYVNGMKSRLLQNKFKLKEGVFYSEFMNDLFTPNVSNPILNGRKLRGQCIIIRLESKIESPNTESVLMSVIINGTPSPKTI